MAEAPRDNPSLTPSDTPSAAPFDFLRVLTLDDLPDPPPGKRGWPWTESSPPIESSPPAGGPWSPIGIGTPSYTQGPYIGETVLPVLFVGGHALEYKL